LIFRQLFDTTSSTYTYLLGDQATGRAVLIDPVLELADRDLAQVHDLGLTLSHVLDTHVHADHVTAASILKSRTNCATVSSERGAVCADVKLKHGEPLHVGSIDIKTLAPPGHTADSHTFLLGDRVVTGAAQLDRGCGRTDFQNGDPETLYKSITEVLFALPDTTEVFPAHDYKGLTVTTIGEERRYNPRVAGKSMAEFSAIMRGLNLPPPRLIDAPVPANRLCGNVPMG
jgi:glyoxylase-like metal-dependent hydrolase (beta-lactamase superfamily II)